MYNAKKFMNTPNSFPAMKENICPPFVVLKHIKLRNLIKQKATNKEQLCTTRMSDQHWLFIKSLNSIIFIKNLANGRLPTNCYFFRDQCINRNFFSVIRLATLINKNTKQYRKPLTWSLEQCGIATLCWYYGLINFEMNIQVRSCFFFSGTVNSWMLSVANRIDSAL